MLSATARGTSLGNQCRAKAAEPEAITVVDTIEDAPEGELCSLEVNKAATALKPARCGAPLSSIKEFPEEEPALAVSAHHLSLHTRVLRTGSPTC